MRVKFQAIHKLAVYGLLAASLLVSRQISAQYLTLEGQTGGFLTPTAYVVYMDKGEKFSHPAVGFHFIDANTVIGNIQTFSITEAFYRRAEAGYTRSVHELGSETTGLNLSSLWDYDGMNVFHGKVVAINDGQFGPWMPGVAVGGVVRTGDHFVSGAANKTLTGTDKSYTNGDVYVAVTKTWAKKPVPFLANIGWKATNATIFGIGGQSSRFGGRFFGGIGFPLPIGKGVVAVPSVGFTQEPGTSKGLGVASYTSLPLVAGKADLPTTLDYAVRITQRERPHFSFDVGIGQVASNIGSAPTFTFPNPSPTGVAPIDLQAKKVLGMGLSYRY